MPPRTFQDAEAACSGCFLYERTGGVCPAARDAYGAAAAEADRRAERLAQAIIEDAGTRVGFHELVRLDAERQSAAPELAAAERLALLRPAAASADPTERKEKVRVHSARTI